MSNSFSNLASKLGAGVVAMSAFSHPAVAQDTTAAPGTAAVPSSPAVPPNPDYVRAFYEAGTISGSGNKTTVWPAYADVAFKKGTTSGEADVYAFSNGKQQVLTLDYWDLQQTFGGMKLETIGGGGPSDFGRYSNIIKSASGQARNASRDFGDIRTTLSGQDGSIGVVEPTRGSWVISGNGNFDPSFVGRPAISLGTPTIPFSIGATHITAASSVDFGGSARDRMFVTATATAPFGIIAKLDARFVEGSAKQNVAILDIEGPSTKWLGGETRLAVSGIARDQNASVMPYVTQDWTVKNTVFEVQAGEALGQRSATIIAFRVRQSFKLGQ